MSFTDRYNSDLSLTESLDLSVPSQYYKSGTRRHYRHRSDRGRRRRDVSRCASVRQTPAGQRGAPVETRVNGDGISFYESSGTKHTFIPGSAAGQSMGMPGPVPKRPRRALSPKRSHYIPAPRPRQPGAGSDGRRQPVGNSLRVTGRFLSSSLSPVLERHVTGYDLGGPDGRDLNMNRPASPKSKMRKYSLDPVRRPLSLSDDSDVRGGDVRALRGTEVRGSIRSRGPPGADVRGEARSCDVRGDALSGNVIQPESPAQEDQSSLMDLYWDTKVEMLGIIESDISIRLEIHDVRQDFLKMLETFENFAKSEPHAPRRMTSPRRHVTSRDPKPAAQASVGDISCITEVESPSKLLRGNVTSSEDHGPLHSTKLGGLYSPPPQNNPPVTDDELQPISDQNRPQPINERASPMGMSMASQRTDVTSDSASSMEISVDFTQTPTQADPATPVDPVTVLRGHAGRRFSADPRSDDLVTPRMTPRRRAEVRRSLPPHMNQSLSFDSPSTIVGTPTPTNRRRSWVPGHHLAGSEDDVTALAASRNLSDSELYLGPHGHSLLQGQFSMDATRDSVPSASVLSSPPSVLGRRPSMPSLLLPTRAAFNRLFHVNDSGSDFSSHESTGQSHSLASSMKESDGLRSTDTTSTSASHRRQYDLRKQASLFSTVSTASGSTQPVAPVNTPNESALSSEGPFIQSEPEQRAGGSDRVLFRLRDHDDSSLQLSPASDHSGNHSLLQRSHSVDVTFSARPPAIGGEEGGARVLPPAERGEPGPAPPPRAASADHVYENLEVFSHHSAPLEAGSRHSQLSHSQSHTSGESQSLDSGAEAAGKAAENPDKLTPAEVTEVTPKKKKRLSLARRLKNFGKQIGLPGKSKKRESTA